MDATATMVTEKEATLRFETGRGLYHSNGRTFYVADLEDRDAAMDRRVVALDQREAALDRREAALVQRETDAVTDARLWMADGPGGTTGLSRWLKRKPKA